MQIEILRNNQLIAGPMKWDAGRVRDIVMRQGADFRLIPNGLIRAVHIGPISVLPVKYVRPELGEHQEYGEAVRGATESEVTYTYPVIDRDPDEVLEERRQERTLEMDAARDTAFAEGMPYQFSDGQADVIQTRPQDQINLLGLSAKAQLLIADGVTDAVMPFRGLSNTTHMLTPQAMSELALAALAHIESIYQQSWQLKDAVNATESIEAVEAISWPEV